MDIFSGGGITLVHPANNAEPLNYFGVSNAFDPPEQMLQKWGYIGQNGQQIKTLGTGGKSGVTHGFLDTNGADPANLDTGVHALMDAVKDSVPGSIMVGTLVIDNGILTKVVFPRQWGYGTRVCMDFIIAWEAP